MSQTAHNVAKNGWYTCQSLGAKVSCALAKPTWAHWVIVGVFMQWAQYYYLPIVLNGPSKLSKICCLWSWMSPVLPSEFGVYGLEWVHHSNTNGPVLLWRNAANTLIINAEKCCWWPWMGPVCLATMVTNIFGWTHYCCWKWLPMSMNGPNVPTKNCCWWTWNGSIIASEKCCWCPWLCLVFLPRNAANTLAWAHYYLLKNAANGHEWAQCFYQEMLLIWLHWPIITAEKYCQWPWMGPVLLPRNAADSLAWDHHCCL